MTSTSAITKPRSSPRAMLRRNTLPAPEAATGRHAAITLSAERRRVRDVRRFAAAVLSQWAIAHDNADSVILIVSELAANSATHGHSELDVLLSLRGHVLHIEVVDSGSTSEHHASTSVDAGEHGRGLDIVAALADELQTRQSSSGWRTCARIRVASEAFAHRVRADARTSR